MFDFLYQYLSFYVASRYSSNFVVMDSETSLDVRYSLNNNQYKTLSVKFSTIFNKHEYISGSHNVLCSQRQ